VIILENIALRRGQKLLFSDASATLQPGQKLALIGGNGCGKSSLFALLLDHLQLTTKRSPSPSTSYTRAS